MRSRATVDARRAGVDARRRAGDIIQLAGCADGVTLGA